MLMTHAYKLRVAYKGIYVYTKAPNKTKSANILTKFYN